MVPASINDFFFVAKFKSLVSLILAYDYFCWKKSSAVFLNGLSATGTY
jgi:hypothetical protein